MEASRGGRIAPRSSPGRSAGLAGGWERRSSGLGRGNRRTA